MLLIVSMALGNNSSSLHDELSKDHVAFDTGWRLADGSGADIAHLNELPSVEPYQKTSIYHELPQDLPEGLSLCFRTKNIFYEVYVGGELRYCPEIPESRGYNDSLGTRWNYVALSEKDEGKAVEVRFYTVYDSSRACIDYIYLGSAAGEILDTIADRLVAFITCLLLIFVGALLIIADIPINMQKEKNHELLYLGFFAVSIATWCLAETNLLQFFTDDSRMLQTVSCCSLILIPIPLVLYLDAAFGFRRHIVVPFVCYLSAIEFVGCTLLHFLKILDYHDTLHASHIMLAISAIMLLVTIIKNSFYKGHLGTGKVRNVYKILRTLGLMSLGFATVIDIVRFYQGNGGDSAMFVRIGLLIFIICYGSSSLEKTINAVKLGVQSEFVSQLAYRDGLTGIGNRTAFQEKLVELEGKKHNIDGICVVMFDVNDLKYVNDNLGHQQGDNMLVCSAGMIQNAFEPVKGLCYRIGGDEFAVVLSGENVQQRCEDGLSEFGAAMKAYNAITGQPFRISIASGYAIYEKPQEDAEDVRLMDIYQQADEHMYVHKREMKKTQVKPEEFYRNRVSSGTTV